MAVVTSSTPTAVRAGTTAVFLDRWVDENLEGGNFPQKLFRSLDKIALVADALKSSDSNYSYLPRNVGVVPYLIAENLILSKFMTDHGDKKAGIFSDTNPERREIGEKAWKMMVEVFSEFYTDEVVESHKETVLGGLAAAVRVMGHFGYCIPGLFKVQGIEWDKDKALRIARNSLRTMKFFYTRKTPGTLTQMEQYLSFVPGNSRAPFALRHFKINEKSERMVFANPREIRDLFGDGEGFCPAAIQLEKGKATAIERLWETWMNMLEVLYFSLYDQNDGILLETFGLDKLDVIMARVFHKVESVK